eukprot:scaffold99382_cov19-Tisochrysis_lutea.AAC.2
MEPTIMLYSSPQRSQLPAWAHMQPDLRGASCSYNHTKHITHLYAVQLITKERVASVGHVQPDLVCPARVGGARHKGGTCELPVAAASTTPANAACAVAASTARAAARAAAAVPRKRDLLPVVGMPVSRSSSCTTGAFSADTALTHFTTPNRATGAATADIAVDGVIATGRCDFLITAASLQTATLYRRTAQACLLRAHAHVRLLRAHAIFAITAAVCIAKSIQAAVQLGITAASSNSSGSSSSS